MKRITFFVFYLLCCITLFAQSAGNADSTEISIYNEITSYNTTGYYPGVVDRTDFLKKNYPESVFITPALVLKGEALVNLGRFSEATETFLLVIPSMHLGSEDFAKTYYLLGKAYYFQQQYNKALDAFYKACSISEKEEKYDYYDISMLYAGRIYYIQGDYAKAVPVFEYIAANGKKFTVKAYDEALQKIFVSYANICEYEKSIELYEELEQYQNDNKRFSDEVFTFFTMYAAESYEKAGKAQKAYNLYNSLIESENQNVSVTALKKAYLVASQNNLDVEPSEVLQRIQRISKNTNSQTIITDFWVRVGIDSYSQKDFAKARECFELAKEAGAAERDAATGDEASAEKESLLIISLYEARMQIEEAVKAGNEVSADKTGGKSAISSLAKELETELSQNQNSYLSAKTKNLTASYYAFLIYCKAAQEDWSSIPPIYEKMREREAAGEKFVDSQTLLLTATAFYKQRKYAEAENIIVTNLTEKENKLLYAEILSRQGKYKEAEVLYEKLYAKKELSLEESLEYAKVLFQQKKWKKAKETALEANQPLSPYLAGLCEIKLKDYTTAKGHFEQYLKKADSYKGEAVYYKGYASYRLGEYKEAYSTFIEFNNNYKLSAELRNKAYDFAAKSALRFGDFDKAALQAEALVSFARNDEERYNAALFCSQIYADKKDYAKAVSTLEPFTKKQTNTAISALFQIAKIYENAGDDDKAEAEYKIIYTDYSRTPEAEEAMYRCGELYYSKGNYKKAEEGFTKYIFTYVGGRFTDAAYYFSGESNLKLGDNNRCIMQNKTLLSKFPQSLYYYAGAKNLMQAYYDEGFYAESLEIAKKIVAKNKKQAEADGIVEKITELEQITAGTDRRIVEKRSEFTKKGELTTVEGRIAGTELVALYAQFDEYYEEGLALAKKLLPLQAPDENSSKKNFDDVLCGAKNADFLALDYENKALYKESAEMYLKAAECYRICGKGYETDAAAALYSASSAFVSANQSGDAKATAKLLKSLYPGSKQANKVDALIK